MNYRGDTLEAMAASGGEFFVTQFPWLGARSLSEAQILYSQIADSIFTHRPGECVELDPFLEGRSDEGYTHEIQIYPNPATDRIYMQLPEWVQHVEIYSLDGRLWKRVSTPYGGSYAITTSDIPSGIYTLRAQGEKQIHTQQISISR